MNIAIMFGKFLTVARLERQRREVAAIKFPPVNLRKCVGCGERYHKSWNGDGERRLCPNCSGAT